MTGRKRRAVFATIGTAALAVLTACGATSTSAGSSSPSAAAGSSGAPSAVAYSACMRAHGVPDFPDPDSGGNLPKADARQLGISDSQLQTAEQTCRHLLPNAGSAVDAGSVQGCMEAGDCPQSLVQRVLAEERRFARCMRSHGVPNWPDPGIDSQGRPVFRISISKLGFDPYSRRVWAEGNGCSHLMPNLPGLPAAVSP